MSRAQERFERSVSAVRELASGQPCWFWMTSRGPEGGPFLVMVEQPSDPDGKKFARRIQWVADNTPELGPTTRGVLRRLRSGRLTLLTPHALTRAGAVYAYTCRFGDLPDVLMMQLDGEQVQSARLVENLSALDAEVGALAPGDRRWFGIADGPPAVRFRLGADRDTVLSEMADASSPLIGQLRRTEDGFELRVKSLRQTRPLSLLLQRWSSGDAGHWSALKLLSNARIAVKDKKPWEPKNG